MAEFILAALHDANTKIRKYAKSFEIQAEWLPGCNGAKPLRCTDSAALWSLYDSHMTFPVMFLALQITHGEGQPLISAFGETVGPTMNTNILGFKHGVSGRVMCRTTAAKCWHTKSQGNEEQDNKKCDPHKHSMTCDPERNPKARKAKLPSWMRSTGKPSKGLCRTSRRRCFQTRKQMIASLKEEATVDDKEKAEAKRKEASSDTSGKFLRYAMNSFCFQMNQDMSRIDATTAESEARTLQLDTAVRQAVADVRFDLAREMA